MSGGPVRFGMVGGGTGAFIGAVHRMALRLDGRGEVVAGALSSDPARALASARELSLTRGYESWQRMLAEEARLPEDDRIEAVIVVTPNATHASIAVAALDAGFHVVLDKPMVVTSAEARAVSEAATRSGRTVTVTYNYSGYPMVREARERVAAGAVGSVRRIYAEYHQGWLATDLEATGQKQASWRTDPAQSGGAGALGDIGTHAEQLIAFVTGMEPESLCAEVTRFVPGRRVDDDAAVQLRYADGARALLTCSQVCVGEENGLSLRVHGSAGSLWWRQESPNRLEVASLDGARRVLTRGSAGLSEAAADATRIPPGHPEGFIEAFANIYRGAMDRIRGVDSIAASLAPTAVDGARGVRFIECALASRDAGGGWVPFAG
ncbi:MAG: Gfo/Idh/MocA family protein [Phycisphaerales bacterium]